MNRLIASAAVASVVFASAAFADTLPNDVAFTADGGVEQPLTATPGNATEGLTVATTRSMGNCIACHAAKGWAKFPEPGNIGPVLDGVGTRYAPAQLRGLVVNAKKHFPGSIMPAFYNVAGIIRPGDNYTAKAPKVVTAILTAQQVEDLVALLATFKD